MWIRRLAFGYLVLEPVRHELEDRPDDSKIERQLVAFSNRIRASLTLMSSGFLFDLTDRVAIVTGSTKGIGRAIAQAFVNHGARVAISGRDPENCEDVASQLNGSGRGGQASGMAKTFEGNLTSVMQLCQLVIPAMQRSKGGSIILVSSVGGLQGNSLLGPYAISKAGVIQLTRNIAVEFGGDGIRANAIVPGLVKTDFAGPLWQNPELAQARIDKTPLGRLGEPEDLAGAAVYLASRAGAWTTAQTIVVDGGAVMVGR